MKTTILDMPFHEALTIMEEWVKAEHDGKLKLKFNYNLNPVLFIYGRNGTYL